MIRFREKPQWILSGASSAVTGAFRNCQEPIESLKGRADLRTQRSAAASPREWREPCTPDPSIDPK